MEPWEHLCVDLIGPYTIRRKGKKDLHTRACTMLDPATGWFEIHEVKHGATSDEIANIVEKCWLTRYPRPERATTDRGKEFIGPEFKDLMLNEYDIDWRTITARNPQANSMIERIHQTLGNIMRTMNMPETFIDEDDPWTGPFCAAAFAIRATYHTTLQKTPGQLVFGRDMLFNIKHIADWELIKENKRKRIQENNKRENSKRKPHTYQVGDKVVLRRGDDYKYETPYTGPHTITEVRNNGTVRLQKGAVIETINIRRLQPFHE